jgi:hypothetical protein
MQQLYSLFDVLSCSSKTLPDTCYHYNETTTNVPPVAGCSSSQMFPGAEEFGSLFSENSGSSSKDNVTVGLTRYEAKASEAINLIQSGSHMLVQAHKDFIHHLWTAMGKEPIDTSGTDTRGRGLDMEVHRTPSEDSPQHMMLCLIFWYIT